MASLSRHFVNRVWCRRAPTRQFLAKKSPARSLQKEDHPEHRRELQPCWSHTSSTTQSYVLALVHQAGKDWVRQQSTQGAAGLRSVRFRRAPGNSVQLAEGCFAFAWVSDYSFSDKPCTRGTMGGRRYR